MTHLKINTDGGARGNPGPAAIGIVIKAEQGKILQKISRKIGFATNNSAEYQAVITALSWIKDNRDNYEDQLTCDFYLDSNLVVNQLNGLFKVKDKNLREFLLQVRLLEQEAKLISKYQVIPREANRQADLLVNQALDSQNFYG